MYSSALRTNGLSNATLSRITRELKRQRKMNGYRARGESKTICRFMVISGITISFSIRLVFILHIVFKAYFHFVSSKIKNKADKVRH
jgi:hypothetical protein